MSAVVRFLNALVRMNGSDLFFQVGKKPGVEIDGRLKPLLADEVSSDLMVILVNELLNCSSSYSEFSTALSEFGVVDFSFIMTKESGLPETRSFRVNIATEWQGRFITIRLISKLAPDPFELGLRRQLIEMITTGSGLYVVTGVTGSGKSTTLASIVNYINKNYAWIIRTIESPIEFYFPQDGLSMITQTEVPIHSKSFQSALEASLRQKPSLIMLGEIRDAKALEVAVHAAETGHAVLTTMHTSSASETVERMVGMAPEAMKPNIRQMLSLCLKGVISQKLLPKIGGGRILAHELILVDSAIAHLIREDKAQQLPSKIQTGRSRGMQTFDDDVFRLFKEGIIEKDVALTYSRDKDDFAKRMLEYLRANPEMASTT